MHGLFVDLGEEAGNVSGIIDLVVLYLFAVSESSKYVFFSSFKSMSTFVSCGYQVLVPLLNAKYLFDDQEPELGVLSDWYNLFLILLFKLIHYLQDAIVFGSCTLGLASQIVLSLLFV